MVRIGSGMSKCVPARSATAWSARSCIQSRNASAPAIRRAGSASSAAQAAGDVVARRPGPGRSAAARSWMRLQLLEAPAVGLLQVDRGAQEGPRVERVALLADGIQAGRQRGQLAAQPVGEVGERLAGRGPPPRPARRRSASGSRPRHRRPGRRRSRRRRSRRSRRGSARRCPAIWRDAETLPSRASAVSVSRTPAQRLAARSAAGRRCWTSPRSVVGRHQVEDRPDLLGLAGDHADPRGGDVGLVQLDLAGRAARASPPWPRPRGRRPGWRGAGRRWSGARGRSGRRARRGSSRSTRRRGR